MLKAFIKDANFGISMLLIALAIGVAAITLPVFGNKALIVKSGSMQPTIKVGDLVAVQSQKGFATPQDVVIPKYKIGDIIAFKNQVDPKIVTTHRIASRETKDGKVYYRTKGDANNSLDTNAVSEENIIGRADYSVKGIGKLFAFAKSKMGLSLLIIFPALMVIVIEFANLLREFKKNHNFSNQIQFPNSAGLKVLIPLLAVALTASSTFAFFSKSAASTGNVFTAAQAFPTPTPGPGDVVINEINWGGSSISTADEWVELRNTTSNVIDLSNWVIEKLGDFDTPNFTIPSGYSIPANGFFLISNRAKATSVINVDPDIVTTSVSLLNGGEQLVLKNNLATIIDRANGTSTWFFGVDDSPGPAKTMERNFLSSDGTISTNWHTATSAVNLDGGATEFGTPKAANGI